VCLNVCGTLEGHGDQKDKMPKSQSQAHRNQHTVQ